MKDKLFGNKRYLSCEYCDSSTKSEDGLILYCKHKGIVQPDSKCHRFSYNPFKRIPKSAPSLPQFDPDEFSL